MTTKGRRAGRVAVIGCGGWGKNHVRVLNGLGVPLTVCDADAGRLRRLGKEFPDARLINEVHTVLADPTIMAVVIATPAETHGALAREALDAGKDVLVEKPMALRASEGIDLTRHAERLGRVLMVGHLLEYHPAVLALRDMVAQGTLGRIRYIYANRVNFGKIRTEENALWSFAPHDVAIINRLLGGTPEAVVCTGKGYLNRDVADATLTSLSYPEDVQAHVFVSWLHPFKEHRFVVVGDEKMAVFDDTRPWQEKLALYPHQVSWREGKIPWASKAEPEFVALDQVEPLAAELQHFLDCISSRESPLTDGESGHRVLRVLELAQRSLEAGGVPQRPTPLDGEGAGPRVFVHPSAVVDGGAVIGAGTKVWHNSHVMGKAVIGRDCVLGQNVFVADNVHVGDRVKIQNNVSVYDGVHLEDGVFCGPSMVFTNVLNPRSEIERKDEFNPTLVRRGATLGANCTIICGNEIGEYSFVAAAAVVTADVPAFALVRGNPARQAGWMCLCGQRLPDDLECACGKVYEETSTGIEITNEVPS